MQLSVTVEYRLTRPDVAPEVVDLARSAIPRRRAHMPTPVIDLFEARRGPTPDQLRRLGPNGPLDVVLDGRYRLERLIGHGGMGAIYLAIDLLKSRRVAVKVLDVDVQDHRWGIAQFLHEARIASSVRHRNIIDVHGFGSTPEGVVYMAMEHLDGHDLESIVSRRRLSWRWTQYMMRQICAGLDAVHRAGIVHRDVKASNCFYVESNATIKILDFGVAARAGDSDELGTSIIGTPEYMAPELIRGCSHAEVDLRADVYAAGILLCKLLTGRTPFRGRTAEAMFDQHLHDEPPSLRDLGAMPDVPAGLDAVVHRALAKRPEDRFASMLDLGAALERVGKSSARLPRLELSDADSSQAWFGRAPTLRQYA